MKLDPAGLTRVFRCQFAVIKTLFFSILLMSSVVGASAAEIDRPKPAVLNATNDDSLTSATSKCGISEPVDVAVVEGRFGTVRVERPVSLSHLGDIEETANLFAGVTHLSNFSIEQQKTTVGIVPESEARNPGWVPAGTNDVCLKGTSSALWDGLMTHEYLHTRQDFETNAEMRWITESTAFYYMAVVPYERGSMSQARANRRLAEPEPKNESVDKSQLVLLDSQSYEIWAGRGPPVLAALDREIRSRTNGERTLEHIMQELNQAGREITYPVFQELVSNVAGESMDEWLDAYITEYTPVGTEVRIEGLTLTAPASEPNYDVTSVKLTMHRVDGIYLPDTAYLTMTEGSQTELDVVIRNHGPVQNRETIQANITSSSGETVAVLSETRTRRPGVGSSTFGEQTNDRLFANLEPGTYSLNVSVGSTRSDHTLIVEPAPTPTTVGPVVNDLSEVDRGSNPETLASYAILLLYAFITITTVVLIGLLAYYVKKS